MAKVRCGPLAASEMQEQRTVCTTNCACLIQLQNNDMHKIKNITSLVAIYFSETFNNCTVRVRNGEIWYRHRINDKINMEIGSVNIKELVKCFSLSSCTT